MSKRKLMTFAAVVASTTVLASCSSGGGSDNTAGGGGGVGESRQPADYDLKAEELTAEGCLQLPAVFEKLKALPADARLRRLTPDFEIKSEGNNNNKLRRNFIAIAAFSNFTYEEKTAALFSLEYPAITQTACDSVRFANALEGEQEMKISATDSPQKLKLVREDGAEFIYELKNTRELEIRFSGQAMDPCPDYAHAMLTNVQTYTWGTEADLAASPLRVSKSFLNQISIGLQDMPDELSSLAAMANTDYVETTARDLRSLMASTLDPRVLACPYKANPPDGTEPPPPPPDASPSPSPSPSPTPEEPTPAPTPDAGPTPSPTPEAPPVVLPGF